ncbi:MAG: carboxymuconolactone decarboxylase family protein [Gammaproteobacteria bacterium]|nr:carboxymuconolactone decarboxylase family protein [Gammaproteobacteria bacterium]
MASSKDQVEAIDRRVGSLAKTAPKVLGAYGQLVQSAMKSGALDDKTKELMAVAISVSVRCEDCILYHTRAAIKLGASEAEYVESLGVAIELGGGPSVVYGARALDAYKSLTNA